MNSKDLKPGCLFIVSNVGKMHSLHNEIGILISIEIDNTEWQGKIYKPNLYKAFIMGRIKMILPRWVELLTHSYTQEKK